MSIYKDELLEKIEEKYGDLNNERGCYSDGVWLSISSIVEIINRYDSNIIDKDELLNDLKRKYGDLDDDRGCYSDGIWLSMAAIKEIIESC